MFEENETYREENPSEQPEKGIKESTLLYTFLFILFAGVIFGLIWNCPG